MKHSAFNDFLDVSEGSRDGKRANKKYFNLAIIISNNYKQHFSMLNIILNTNVNTNVYSFIHLPDRRYY